MSGVNNIRYVSEILADTRYFNEFFIQVKIKNEKLEELEQIWEKRSNKYYSTCFLGDQTRRNILEHEMDNAWDAWNEYFQKSGQELNDLAYRLISKAQNEKQRIKDADRQERIRIKVGKRMLTTNLPYYPNIT